MLHRIVPLWSLYIWVNATSMWIVGFFITVKKITVKTEQSSFFFLKKHSRVRNNLAVCGGGLANLTDCSRLCLPSCYRNDKSTRKPVQVTHNYLHFTSLPPIVMMWLKIRWGLVSESNVYPQLTLTLSSRKYMALCPFGLTDT